jgi:hypothetical protein
MARRQTYIYYLLLFLTAVAAFWPVAVMQHPLKYDMIDQAYPWRYFIGQCLQDGIFPLWNPYQLLGSPIHADPQSSAWYPVTWFFGYFFGYNIYVISIDFMLHIFLAGMGMFYLGRALKFRPETTFLMAVSYMLSGFFTGNAQHFMWIISGTWIPFIIGAFISLKENPSLVAAIRLGLAFFMIMTGGYPAFIFLTIYLLIFINIVFLTEYLRKRDYKGLARFSVNLGFAAVFTILAGMVILTSVYHLPDAMTRGSGVTLRQALFGAFTPRSFISFFLPFASIRDMEFYGTDLSMSNAYFGLMMLVFLLAGIMIRRTRLVNVFLAWGVFCLLASVGSALPVREFLYHWVPFMNLFRFPALFRVFVILSFIVVAGHAFDAWRNGELSIRKRVLYPVLGIGCLVLGVVGYSFVNGNPDLADLIRNQLFIDSNKTSIDQHIFFQGIIQLIFIILIILLLTIWKNKKHAVMIMILVGCVDLILATRLNGAYTVYTQDFSSKDIYVHSKKFPDGFPLPDDKPILNNMDTKGLVYKALWRNMNIFHKQVSWEGYNPLHLKGFEEMADNHPKLFETILQNPLVYLTENVCPMDSLAGQEAKGNFQAGRVYLTKEEYCRLSIADCRLSKEDSANISDFSPVEIKIACNSAHNVLLNYLQNNYYGWKVKIDGRPASLMTGNMSFLAALVPAGEHEVVFYYDPVAVKIGFWISLLSVLAGVSLLIRRFLPLRH